MSELRLVRRKIPVAINPNVALGYWAEHVPTELVLQQRVINWGPDGYVSVWQDVPTVDEDVQP